MFACAKADVGLAVVESDVAEADGAKTVREGLRAERNE